MRFFIFVALLFTVFSQYSYTQTPHGIIQGQILLRGTHENVPCNIIIKDSGGKPYRPDSTYVWISFVNGVYPEFPCEGSFTLRQLPYGTYTYEIDRGPEYTSPHGSFVVDRDSQHIVFPIERITDMKLKNWWSGETHIHRNLKHIPLLMKASDLHIGVVNTVWNKDNRSPYQYDSILHPVQAGKDIFYSVTGAEDERTGGALLYLNSSKLIRFNIGDDEYPPMTETLYKTVKDYPNVWVDLEKSFWWDLPFFLSTGKINSVGIAHNHMNKRSMFDTEALGRSRDKEKYPTTNGNAYYTQDIYYNILNTGLRIPPSAGSASGVLPTSVGYNRMYAYVENGLTYDKWWKAVKEGKVFVSNGPLLDCRADGELPGHIFSSTGKKLDIHIAAELFSRDTLESIQIIKNGRIYQTISPDNLHGGKYNMSVSFGESGWFLVRVICKKYNTFRFASTAPYYVEIGKNKRLISRSAVRYFLDWAELRASKINIKDPAIKQKAFITVNKGISYWQDLLKKANAE